MANMPSRAPMMITYVPWKKLRWKLIWLNVGIQGSFLAVGIIVIGLQGFLREGFFSGFDVLSVVIPLSLFAIVVLGFGIYFCVPDRDIQNIHLILGTNLFGVLALMLDTPVGNQYGLDWHTRARLQELRHSSETLKYVQRLFATHRVREKVPPAWITLILESLLLVIGAALGNVFQDRLGPPPGVQVNLSSMDLGVLFGAAIPSLMLVAAFVLLFVISVVREIRERRTSVAMMKHPEGLRFILSTFLPVTDEVREKVHAIMREVASLSRIDPNEVSALEGVAGAEIIRRGWRLSALGEIQWMVGGFGGGLLLGAVLPALMGW